MILSLDTETELTAQGCQAPRLVCVSTAWDGGETLDRHDTAPLREILESDATIVGHYIAFDMAVIVSHDPSLTPLIFDAYDQDRIVCTEVRERLLTIATGGFEQSNSLAACVQRRLGIVLDKGWQTGFTALRDFPLDAWPEAARRYAIDDAIAALALYGAQGGHETFVDQFRQSRASFWLRLMSAWGITTDPNKVQALADRTQLEYESIAADLRVAGLLRQDKRKRDGTIVQGSRDTKAVARRMIQAYAARGETPPSTPTERVCLDEKACNHSGDPLLVRYGRFGSIKSTLAKDIPLLAQGLIHSRYDVLADTGRTRSSGPNVQNLPRQGGVRECFVPRPGYVYVNADYSGAELATLAQICLSLFGYSSLADELNAGLDPHLKVAEQILSRPYEDLKRDKKTHAVDMARQTGKVLNFGAPGGLGAARLVSYAEASYGVILTEVQARDLKALWLRIRPEMREYFRYIDACTNTGNIVQLYSGRVRSKASYTENCNTLFQGLAADMAKDAGWRIARACYLDESSPLYGSRLVLFGHDEFLAESPEDRAPEAALAMSALMLAAAAVWVPNIKIKAEPLLARCYSKSAEPLTDDTGRLVPWQN